MQKIEEILEQTKATWNKYLVDSEENIYREGYICRAESKEEHYRSGYWDFPRLIALPLQKMGYRNFKDVLEIGVGTGRLIGPAANMYHQIYGIDFSEEVILKAVLRLDEISCYNAELKINDGQNIPYPDGKFDMVYSFVVFIHIPSKKIVENYIKETFRVLKKGGVARIHLRYSEFTSKNFEQIEKDWNYTKGCSWTTFEAMKMFGNAGFKNIDPEILKRKDKRQLWITAVKS